MLYDTQIFHTTQYLTSPDSSIRFKFDFSGFVVSYTVFKLYICVN